MGLFDFFRSKSSKGFDIASIVQQMFDESGITPRISSLERCFFAFFHLSKDVFLEEWAHFYAN